MPDDSQHPFGSPAAGHVAESHRDSEMAVSERLSHVTGPKLCVPALRLVCPFEDDDAAGPSIAETALRPSASTCDRERSRRREAFARLTLRGAICLRGRRFHVMPPPKHYVTSVRSQIADLKQSGKIPKMTLEDVWGPCDQRKGYYPSRRDSTRPAQLAEPLPTTAREQDRHVANSDQL